MNKQKYLDDLHEIKDIMDKSSRFISLSGWSGVSAGLIALITAYIAYGILGSMGLDLSDPIENGMYETTISNGLSSQPLYTLIVLGIGALVLAVTAGIFFTTRAAKKNNQKIWGFQTKRLLVSLSIPLIVGGLFCLILLFRNNIVLIAPLTLIFYGLGLINASKYTLQEIRGLGMIQVVLGLLAACCTGYGLFFWAFGFGVMHIIYGIYMQLKYKS